MNTFTHTLMPVLAIGLIRHVRLNNNPLSKHVPSAKEIIAVGLFGAGPDLLNPHLSLAARYTSWSHSIWFWSILTIILLCIGLSKWPKLTPKMALWLSGAFILHIFCDFIAGGIAWNYPFSDTTIGSYYVSPTWWIPLDIFFILSCYFLFRVVSLWKKRNRVSTTRS